MKRILITGGCGFIGSHICLLLLQKGFDVVVIDSFVNSSAYSLEKVLFVLKNTKSYSKNKLNVIKGDLRSEDDIEEIFRNSQKEKKPISAVIHLAGLKSIEDSILYPLLYWENNVAGSINLLKIMHKYKCKFLVFSSSATIYGVNDNRMISENDKLNPINPYGMNKFVIEKFLADISGNCSTELSTANLRYFNPIGAHPSGLIGENPLGSPRNIFPLITKVALGKIKELKIFGNDWPTPDGTCIRDYIHIMDLAEGHLLALNYLFNNAPKIVNINLGTGIGTSVLDLIKNYECANKIKIPFIFAPRRKGDKPFVVADNSLAKNLINWHPQKNLSDMCRDGFNWGKKNLEHF